MLSTVFDLTISELCPTSAPFFGFMGVAASIIFASMLAGVRLLCSRPRFCLRNRQGRCWCMLHGCVQT